MKKLSLLAILIFCFSLNQSLAQFEGKIRFQDYEIKSGDKQKDDDAFTMFVTKDRILLKGDKGYKVGGSLETEGVLIRHKEKDFVFMTGEKEAMSISKSGITSFMNMFGGDARGELKQAESNIKIKKTGESKKLNGYSAEKFVITDRKKPAARSEVWMTKAVDINWGILAESWGDNLKGFTGSELPLDLIFNEGYFPILWEQYENDTLTDVVETEITATDIAREMVEISSDVKVLSFQNYLFEQMRKKQ
jgi:hypothetical protein